MSLTAADYVRQLKQLLPRGVLWRLDPDSFLSKLLLGIAEELARIDARGEDLQREWSPATATAAECLDDWERVLGLPDPLLENPPTVEADRQVAATSKYVMRGGQSRQYMIDLAASLGFVATIEDGVTPYHWTMTIDLSLAEPGFNLRETECRLGTARCPDRIGDNVTIEELESIVWRANPAHTYAHFIYFYS